MDRSRASQVQPGDSRKARQAGFQGVVAEAVQRDLDEMGAIPGGAALAEAALALARSIDRPDSTTSQAMCAKELRDTMSALRALAPAKREQDAVDDLMAKRAQRLAQAK